VFGSQEAIPRDQMVCRAVRKVHDQVKSSSRPDLPIIFSEYNASYKTEPDVTDSEFMGPWLADTIRQCDGLVDMLSYWTFSDVFEEQGVVKQPFYGGYGLIAEGGVPKPAFNAFKVLHKLGDQRIENGSHSALITKRSDGTVVLAVWNLWPAEEAGTARQVKIKFAGHAEKFSAKIYRVDSAHGSPLRAYSEMGKPAYPTSEQYKELRKSAELPAPEEKQISNGELTITLPPKGLAILEFKR
jgi:xylan 1,4-beta-xylosidase